MEGDKQLQDVTKEVLTFVAFQLGMLPELPAVSVHSINPDLIENLRMIIWVERYVAYVDCKEFMWKFIARMTTSPQLYTKYVIYACQAATKCFADVYEKFVRALTISVEISIYSMLQRQTELLGWTLTIFSTFFEKELKRDFYDRGGWKKFNKYLLRKNSSKMFPAVNLLEKKGKKPSEMAEILGVESTVLKEYLDQTRTESDVENHGPTLSIWEMVEETGFSAGSKFIHQLLQSQMMTTVGETQQQDDKEQDLSYSMTATGPEIAGANGVENFIKPEHKQPIVRCSVVNRIAYTQAKESLRAMQTDCLRVEQLLDFIFGDMQDNI